MTYENINEIIEGMSLDEFQEFFSRLPNIKLIEEYDDAREEVECLFPNMIELLQYEGVEHLIAEYTPAKMFF